MLEMTRIEWFLNAVEKVEKCSYHPEETVLFSLYLERHCKTLDELKEEMYKVFPILRPNPEKYGHCCACKKPRSEYDAMNSQGSQCANCFVKAVEQIRSEG